MNINEAFQIVMQDVMENKNWTRHQLANKVNKMANSSVYAMFEEGHKVTMLSGAHVAEALGVSLPVMIKRAQALQKVAV